MAKQFSPQETLKYILDSSEDVADTISEDFDEAFETEEHLEQDQDHNETDEENSDEEDADEEPNTDLSKIGSIHWTSSPPPISTVMCRTCNNPVCRSHAVYHAYCLQCTNSQTTNYRS
ncbi:unnamed protein product [Leuciscus chuanchicus]